MKLDVVLADDELLGEVKPTAATVSTEEQRILQSFEEINLFIDRYQHQPGDATKLSVSEHGLQIKLNGLLNDTTTHALLHRYDRHGLLPSAESKPLSFDDILDDDDLLVAPSDHIFNRVHTRSAIAKTDKVSGRQTCKDFETFKPLFDQCAMALKTGQREAISFAKEQEITAGDFFILKGVMAYVAEVGATHRVLPLYDVINRSRELPTS